jgi:hypothetical protein
MATGRSSSSATTAARSTPRARLDRRQGLPASSVAPRWHAHTRTRAHRRRGTITGYPGDEDTFDRSLERFAIAYADQNDADYATFTHAADEQRIDVERDM